MGEYYKFWSSEQARQISSKLREAKCPVARSALLDTAGMANDIPGILNNLERLQEEVKEAIQKIENLQDSQTLRT